MSDVLTAPDDDLFWPPTDRTEAESPDAARVTDPRIFAFLGSRVISFSPAPDRVVVWCAAVPKVDMFTQPAATRRLSGLHSGCTSAPRGWEASLVTFLSFAEIDTREAERTLWYSTNPTVEPEGSETTELPMRSPRPDVDQAVAAIKELFGLTDEQLEAATGVSRSTLWRLRTGRTGGTRSVTETPIWRLHGLARAMAESIGVENLRSWLNAGDPSPRAMLVAGELERVERAADRLLFTDALLPRTASAVAQDDYEPVLPPSTALRGPAKRPRRVRRSGERSA